MTLEQAKEIGRLEAELAMHRERHKIREKEIKKNRDEMIKWRAQSHGVSFEEMEKCVIREEEHWENYMKEVVEKIKNK